MGALSRTSENCLVYRLWLPQTQVQRFVKNKGKQENYDPHRKSGEGNENRSKISFQSNINIQVQDSKHCVHLKKIGTKTQSISQF